MNTITLNDFFKTQHLAYAIYDSQRSIAHAIDGQKITARKVLHTCSIRANTDIKVAQLCSQVAYETAFHHGEAGIGGVICNLAQSFTGANNLNLLEPIGQFGSRLSPIPAAHRYIFTKLSGNFRTLFKKEDELVTEYLYEDDQRIEPKHYVPILPVVLINGTQGIGTGFASKVLSYNPKDIKQDVINILKGKSRKMLIPWYNNFKGTVSKGENDNQWINSGVLEVVNPTTIKISELPIGFYLDDIKQTLNSLKENGTIKDYDDNSSEEEFNIEIRCQKTTTSLSLDKLYELFKMTSKDTENLTLWNTDDKLQVFDSAADIVKYFTEYRLIKYEERRLALIQNVKTEILDLEEKIRFIEFYLINTQVFRDSSKKQLIELLEYNQFTNPSRLLDMSIYNLTKDKIDELLAALKNKNDLLVNLNMQDARSMYLKELDELKL